MQTGMMERRPVLAAALLAATLGLAAPAAAQGAGDYPTGPITMIVPFAPGGASDFAARLLQPPLSAALGQQVVIENRDGAAGNIGMELAARAKPGGYTLFFGNIGTVSVNPYVFKTLRVKPLQDFEPISIVADVPGIMIANPEFPPNNIQELVAYAKERPGKINFASAGASSVNRLEMESFMRAAGIEMVHVPYKGGAGPAITAVLGNHVSLMFTSIGSVMNQVKDGRLKALAVTSREPVAMLPDVKPMAQQGFPNNVSSSWQGVLAPAGTPPAIIQKIHAAIVTAMKDPTVQSRMATAGVVATSSLSPQAFRDFLEKDAAKWQAAVVAAGASTD